MPVVLASLTNPYLDALRAYTVGLGSGKDQADILALQQGNRSAEQLNRGILTVGAHLEQLRREKLEDQRKAQSVADRFKFLERGEELAKERSDSSATIRAGIRQQTAAGAAAAKQQADAAKAEADRFKAADKAFGGGLDSFIDAQIRAGLSEEGQSIAQGTTQGAQQGFAGLPGGVGDAFGAAQGQAQAIQGGFQGAFGQDNQLTREFQQMQAGLLQQAEAGGFGLEHSERQIQRINQLRVATGEAMEQLSKGELNPIQATAVLNQINQQRAGIHKTLKKKPLTPKQQAQGLMFAYPNAPEGTMAQVRDRGGHPYVDIIQIPDDPEVKARIEAEKNRAKSENDKYNDAVQAAVKDARHLLGPDHPKYMPLSEAVVEQMKLREQFDNKTGVFAPPPPTPPFLTDVEAGEVPQQAAPPPNPAGAIRNIVETNGPDPEQWDAQTQARGAEFAEQAGLELIAELVQQGVPLSEAKPEVRARLDQYDRIINAAKPVPAKAG